MQVTILGCGGSLGVPQLTCGCYVCTSPNPKNKRTRCSIYVESDETKILVDTSSDFRAQALKNQITQVDAVLFTHAHADHISGVDDVKPFAYRRKELMPVYIGQQALSWITGSYGYLFQTESSVYRPLLKPNIIEPYESFYVGDIEVFPYEQGHGEIKSLGFRFGNIAYSTDCNNLPNKSIQALQNLDVLIIDCLRYYWAPTHMIYETTLDMIELIKPRRAILTHLAHDFDYDELKKMLPSYVEPAFDGMKIMPGL